MLTRTFSHLPGLGLKTERRLWAQGCETWDQFLAEPRRFTVGSASRDLILRGVQKSKDALLARNHQFFRGALKVTDVWRAWPEFKDSCAYLDIETDGGSGPESITCIGIWDGRGFQCLVKGEDLGNFPDVISHYQMIVTFYGSAFDLPVIQRAFPRCRLDQLHLDLCFALKNLGMRGGLKKIELDNGIQRPAEIAGLNGNDAVLLWRRHLRGSGDALEKLIAYNRADVVNLERLTEIAYEGLREQVLTGSGEAAPRRGRRRSY